jgi:microcin C transport system ATP-binding protein
VRALAHAVVVMQNGDVVETGDSRSIFAAPKTEYTRTLLAAAFDLELAAE